MRQVKLTGREASVVRAIGFTESMLGAEIQDFVRMESEDVTDTLNSLMAAGASPPGAERGARRKVAESLPRPALPER